MKAFHADPARIKTLRVQKSWPQEQLAEIADVSPRTIQRVEAGGNASYETLRSIASALDVEIRDLLAAQPVVSAGCDPEDTLAEQRVKLNVPAGLSAARSDRRLKFICGILSTLLFGATLFEVLTRDPWSSQVSGQREVRAARQIGIVATNVPQKQAGLLLGNNLPVGYEGPLPYKAKGSVMIRPRTRAKTQLSQQTRMQKTDNPSVMPPEVARSNDVLPEQTILPVVLEISDAFRPVPQIAATSTSLVTRESSYADPQLREAELETPEGLVLRVKHAATGHALSTSDTMRRSSKRMASFFARLGTTVRKSF